MSILNLVVAKMTTTTIIEAAALAVIVLGFLGFKIYKRLTVVNSIVNATITRDSYRIVELSKINDKYKFENVEKDYHYEFEVNTKDEAKSFDTSEALHELVKEKIVQLKDICKKAEYNKKLYPKYEQDVNNIYFNKKILIGEATTKQVSLGTYKKLEKAHFNEMKYKPATEVFFHIDVKAKDNGKVVSTVYTDDDVKEIFSEIEREGRKRPH